MSPRRQSSPVLDEGKVAGGRTSYGEIKNELGVEPGAYLDKLERDYGILERKMPFNAAPKGKNGQYKEVKRDVRDIRLSLLDGKTKAYFEKNGMPQKGWTVRCLGLSLEDM